MTDTSGLLETYASYVPALIVRSRAIDPAPITAPSAERFLAALLFADITGSTALAERLCQRGAIGAEELSRLLNIYFGQLISTVTAHGGDVVKFGGDALLACWRAMVTDDDLPTLTRHAAQCGLALQAKLHDYEVAEGLRLSLRVGIGAGEVMAATVGGVGGRWEFLVAGAPLVQMSLAEHQADPGQVVVAPEAWALLQEHFVGYELLEGGVRLETVHDPLPLRPLRQVSPAPGCEAALRGYIPNTILPRLEAGQIGWLAEHRRTTVMFLCVAGLEHCGTDALSRLQDLMQIVQTTVYRYGGSIGRFSVDDKGTILLAAFGLPSRTHEDDPVRAVLAALGIQARLCALGLDCGIGIATGAVFCGSIGSKARREYTMVGDVVNTAARLMKASQNDVLCTKDTHQAARTRLPFQTLPQFALKGKAESVAVYRARGDAEEAQRLPTMVGRTAERDTLAAHLQALEEGRSGALLIEGEAGIGKSRLVADLLQQASARGVTGWLGAGDALEESTPYHAWRPIFRQLFGLDELMDLKERRARVQNRLARDGEPSRLAPLLNAVLSVDLDENEFTEELAGVVRADNTHDLLVHLLQKAATTAPLLLVLEDAHWMDSASWALTRLVHKHVQPLLLVSAARPMDSPLPEPYLLVRDAPGTQRLQLDALSPGDTRELLSERLGVPGLSETLVALIYDWAEGNPFFTEELAYFLRDSGQILVADSVCQVAPDAGDLSTLKLPGKVQGVIDSRMERLTIGQQFTMQVASTLGRVFSERLLRDIYPDNRLKDRLSQHLEGLEHLDILRFEPGAPERTYAFKHAYTRDAAYKRLPFADRREWHRRIAEWYERNYADDLTPFYPVLAHHWREADVRSKTIDCLEKAGEQALRSFANQETETFLGQALELDAKSDPREDPVRRARWELQLGEACVNRSKYVKGRQHLEAGLMLLGKPVPKAVPGQGMDLLVQVLRQFVHRLWPRRYVERVSEQRDVLLAAARAHERLAEVYYFANESVLAMVAALRTVNLAESAGPALERSALGSGDLRSSQPVNLAESAGLSPELARGYATLGALVGFVPLRGMAEAYFRRAQEPIAGDGRQPAGAFVSLTLGFYAAGIGDWARAKRHFEDTVSVSKRLGDRRRRDDGLGNLVYVHYFQGECSAGEAVAGDLIRSAIHREDPRSWASGLQAKATCLLRLGRFGQAIDCLKEAQALHGGGKDIADAREEGKAPDVVDKALEMERYGLFSIAYLHQSEYDEALRVTRHLAALTAGAYPGNYSALLAYAAPAEVYLTLWEAQVPEPDLDRLARKACKSLRSYARVFPIGEPRSLLWQGLYDWLDGKPAKAQRAWQESLGVAERLNMPFDQGLAHYEMGRHLDAEDPARRQHLDRARDLFAGLGASYHMALAEEHSQPPSV